MSRRILNFRDIRNQVMNTQQILKAASVVQADTSKVFFVTSILGSAITIKDAAGTTIAASVAARDFAFPLRLDYGFTITGTNLTVVFGYVQS